ncbi:MAG: 23S rRNA (pseudouridine(1915)-N(3))-methyltransferase RlmH [Clostridia bacterium]|nr:23S rRNA (pseudouridine(1915)-N(3))-methyltransferase RlmH [Clostridia bacterium]
MLNIQLVCVGNIKEKFFTDAIEEYKKRLQSFCKLEITELKEYKLNKENNQEINNALQLEGKEIIKKLKGYTIALAINGKSYTSENLAKHIEELQVKGNSQLTFIIGSSYGLSQEVLNSVNEKLSFSALTFPHQLMRVILLEQTYRAFTILNGKNYHK